MALTINNQSGPTYTFVAGDKDNLVNFAHAVGTLATLPSGAAIGDVFNARQDDAAGPVTLVAPPGETLSLPANLSATTGAAGATVTAYKFAASKWALAGGFQNSTLLFDTGDPGGVVTASGSTFSSKGFFLTPSRALTLIAAHPHMAPVNGATYKVVVAALNASRVIQSIVATSESRTLSGTAQALYQFNFPAPAALLAGTLYAVLLVRTDSTATTAMGLVASNFQGTFRTIPAAVAAASAGRIASANPIAGDTVDNNAATTGFFQIGLTARY